MYNRNLLLNGWTVFWRENNKKFFPTWAHFYGDDEDGIELVRGLAEPKTEPLHQRPPLVLRKNQILGSEICATVVTNIA